MNGVGALAKIACGVIVTGLAVHHLGKQQSTGTAFSPPVLPESVLAPTPQPAYSGPRVARFRADAYGQFWINGTANGAAFRFLADTGANDIAFNKRDARRLGLDVNRLVFDGWSSTANGRVRTASMRIARLTVGPFTVVDVPGSIIEGELEEPLLGMAFLRRLNVSISNGTLTLSGEPYL